MNDRIEIDGDLVRIKLHEVDQNFRTVLNRHGGINYEHCSVKSLMTDKKGRDALRDCINCLEATGSFAALSDYVPIPYVGKTVLVTEYPDGELWIVVDIMGDNVRLRRDGRIDDTLRVNVSKDRLLAITPPKPKARPYTYLEAVHYLGDTFKYGGNEFQLDSICKTAIQQVPDCQ